MKIFKSFQKCLALAALCASSHLVGQEACCDSPCDSGSFFCLDDIYLRAGYNSDRGIGRTPGYGTVAVYYDPMPTCGEFAPYVDVRGHYLDNNKWAVNAGGGLQYAAAEGALYRGYVFYDWLQLRNGSRGHDHRNHKNIDQVSFGFERIGQEFDLRFNAYFPTHQRRKNHVREFDYPGGFIARQSNHFNAWRGFDLSASTPISICDWICFYTTAGLYYFYNKHDREQHFSVHNQDRRKDAFGGLVRLETTIYRGLVGGVQVAYDERFKTCVSGEINWYFGFPGCNTNCNTCDDCFCMFPVRRQELIVTDHRCHWKLNY